MTATAAVLTRHRTDVIAGLHRQPTERVRIGYWLATDLQATGWSVHDLGTDEARGGFIAGTPTGAVHYRPALVDDGTPAGTLAYHVAQMSLPERDHLRRLLANRPVGHRCADLLPGFLHQPRRPVRIGYWLIKALQRDGIGVRAVGQRCAQGGFITVDTDGRETTYPPAAIDDGTEAGTLAHHISTLSFVDRESLARIVGR